MNSDFHNLPDGARVILHPAPHNPLHSEPVTAVYQGGYYYCEGSDPMDGPDYYFRDVDMFCAGYERLSS